jgi:hypothetical protein
MSDYTANTPPYPWYSGGTALPTQRPNTAAPIPREAALPASAVINRAFAPHLKLNDAPRSTTANGEPR